MMVCKNCRQPIKMGRGKAYRHADVEQKVCDAAVPFGRENKMTTMPKEEQLAKMLHGWYLEATEKISEGSYNPEAKKTYDKLTEEQRYIDRHIAMRIIELSQSFGTEEGVIQAHEKPASSFSVHSGRAASQIGECGEVAKGQEGCESPHALEEGEPPINAQSTIGKDVASPSSPFKLLVCGSRKKVTNYRALVYARISRLEFPPTEIIEGCCEDSADVYAEEWAKETGIVCHHYPSHQGNYLRRNIEMVLECDAVLAFWDGYSYGTAHTIAQGVLNHKKVVVVKL